MYTEVFWRKDATSFPVEYTSTPIHDERGELAGAVVTFNDITQRRTVERMKDEFVSVVSHEPRTRPSPASFSWRPMAMELLGPRACRRAGG